MPRSPLRLTRVTTAAALAAILAPATAATQSAGRPPGQSALASWLALDAPAAHERLATDVIQGTMDGWERDDFGSLVMRRGSGPPLRVVACGLDRPGYAVTQITDAGYLRVHRVGSVRRHPLWDQFHEGQQVTIHTTAGPVPGVSAIANGHFALQHRADSAVVTADALWVDVGAESRAAVDELGIELLDPLSRALPPWIYAEQLAGADAGERIGCAAVASAAAAGAPASGTTVYVLSAQSTLGWVGLGAVLARLGTVDRVTMVERGGTERVRTMMEAARAGALAPVLRAAGVDSVRVLAPDVRFAGTLVESVEAREADRLLAGVARAAGLPADASPTWVELPRRETNPVAPGERPDSLSYIAEMLAYFAELPGPPGHEERVRRAVYEELPDWARASAVTDSAGNVIVAAGPERDTLVLMAHMDEVAYEVTAIAPDGTVSLARRGGAIDSAWEGQPALLHFDAGPDGRMPEPLRGVFVPRERAETKQPANVTAWFGRDSTALAAAGVRPGLGVTAFKRAVRIGENRFAARSLDDRAGTTALLLALRSLDPAALRRRVIFVWSTEEEVGLFGAGALAERLGSTVRRIYSVDTFVSSDTPLESPHFAHAPLGRGPVLRVIDNANAYPPAERERTLEIARTAGIPLQVGLTQGSTDGTRFTVWGAPNAGLAWPGRYSHSPAEVLDLRDLHRLAALIRAVATQ